MIFSNTQKICAAMILLICALQTTAQTENLLAQLIGRTTDAEVQNIIETRSAAELREVCDSIIKQDDSENFIKDFSERVRVLKLAQIIAQKIKYADVEIKTFHRLGLIYFQEGQMPTALEYYNQSLVVAEKENNLKSQANTLSGIALVYRNQADYNKTLEYYNRALKIFEAIGDPQMTMILSGIGTIYMYRGDYNEAEVMFRRGLEIAEQKNNLEGVADSFFHLAIINRLRGNYGEALRLYQKSREISDRFSPSSTVLRHIGGTYFLQGNLRLAFDYGNQALMLDETRKDTSGIAYSVQFIAIIRVSEKNYREALRLAERTEPMFEKLGDNDGLARSLALLGNIYLSIGENDKSLGYFRHALVLREESGNRDGMAVARIGLARVFLAQKKFAESLELAEKAANSAQENGNRELLWQAQSLIGQIYLAQNECDKTRIAFDAAIGTIESLRGEVIGGASDNSLFFAERIKPYQQLAMMLAKEGDFAESFEYAERAKARVLLDAVRFGRNQQTANMSDEEKREENFLRSNVSSLNAQISRIALADKQKIEDLKTKLEAARTALARFQTNLYAAHPDLRIKRGAVKPIEIGEIGNLLDDKSALLEYLVSDESILLFVFTKTNNQLEFKTYRINVGREELNKRIECFRQKLAGRNVLFASESRSLYDAILRPAVLQLAGKTSLTIVPDDGLWELPFQALQSGENHYVLDDASISYSPSLTILRELRGNPRAEIEGAKTLLAFGNPLDGAKTINVNFTALPEAEKQTLALKNLYGANFSSIFNRVEASETTLKREAAKGFSILHLATHGVLDNNSPLNSYVLLAPNLAAGDDGKLEAWEILEMNLNFDLVMLSACETARGQMRSGEGLIGLAWSLMVAGSRNVVVSQWKVESASTTDLTIEFYKSLKQTNAPAKPEALRRAALKLRRNSLTAHPFYWAGFVLIGEAN